MTTCSHFLGLCVHHDGMQHHVLSITPVSWCHVSLLLLLCIAKSSIQRTLHSSPLNLQDSLTALPPQEVTMTGARIGAHETTLEIAFKPERKPDFLALRSLLILTRNQYFPKTTIIHNFPLVHPGSAQNRTMILNQVIELQILIHLPMAGKLQWDTGLLNCFTILKSPFFGMNFK